MAIRDRVRRVRSIGRRDRVFSSRRRRKAELLLRLEIKPSCHETIHRGPRGVPLPPIHAGAKAGRIGEVEAGMVLQIFLEERKLHRPAKLAARRLAEVQPAEIRPEFAAGIPPAALVPWPQYQEDLMLP